MQEKGGRRDDRSSEKFVIPKIKEARQEDAKEQRSPRDPRIRSQSPKERTYERGNTLGMMDRDSRSPEKRYDWKKSSERGDSRESSQERKTSYKSGEDRRERSRDSQDSRDNRESRDGRDSRREYRES